MVDGSTRRLPNWLAVGGEDKKKTPVENKLPKEKPTPPTNSVSPAKKRNSLPPAVSGAGNRRKRKAKNLVVGTHKEIEEDEYALTVEDLVSIAQEVVKDSQDSEPSLSLLLSSTNDLQGSNDHQFSSASIASTTTLNLTTEQSFSSFPRTDDPAQDMLNLLLGPLLGKPQPNDMSLDSQKQQSQKNDFREETLPPTKKKSSLKDKVSFLLD